MILRPVLTVLAIAACSDRSASDRGGQGAADDPWATPRRSSAAPERRAPPVRKLSMDGEIKASPELLATPLPGYDDPKVGDWRAYRHITLGNLGAFHATAIAIVTAVTPSSVTIEFSGRLDETGEQRTDGADEFPRSFTVAHEIHRQHGNWTASLVGLTDDIHSIAGRTFRCKKLVASFDDPMMPGKDTTVEACLSPEVPAGGEVFVREVQKTPTFTITSTSDLIGFGNAHDTLWGKRPPGF